MATMRSVRISTGLLIVGAVFVWTALMVGGAARGIIRPDPFARRLAATLSDRRVAAYVAARITDNIVAQRPNLVSVRPVLESAVSAIVTSAPFRAAVRSTARAAHRSMFEAAGKNVILSLPDVSVLIRGALENASPDLAAKIPPNVEATLASPEAERAFTRFIALWVLIGRVLWGAWILLLVGLASLMAAIWLAPDRHTGLVRVGGALFGVGLVLLAVLPAGRLVAAALTPDAVERGVIHGLWAAYWAAVKPVAVVAGSIGFVLAAGGSTVVQNFEPFTRVKAFWTWLTSPAPGRGKLIGRAIVLIGAGACAVITPIKTVTALLVIAGAALMFVGLREIFRLVLAAVPGTLAGPAAVKSEARVWRIVAAVAAVLAVLLGGAALLVFPERDLPRESGQVVTACNGSSILCSRRLDQVVFAGAHNAMSNAEVPGWMFPHHHRAIARQLEDGIRALAIDVHYGVAAGDRVITDMEREGVSKEKIEESLGPEATAAALRIRDRLMGQETGPSALYFCHGFCELGAYPVVPVLEDIREFLLANPGEVVIIVVEDYVTPEDLAAAFEEAELVDLIYQGPPLVRPLPTLRRLIDRDERLLVFTESGRPGVSWLRPLFRSMQETPYSFREASDFSCRPNRGGTTGPLFQINHWLETTPAPRPTNAEIVNAYDLLLARANACRSERHRLPNVVAVDFYDVGDLFRVVQTLNGVGDVARATSRDR
jgi:hypothetical protein